MHSYIYLHTDLLKLGLKIRKDGAKFVVDAAVNGGKAVIGKAKDVANAAVNVGKAAVDNVKNLLNRFNGNDMLAEVRSSFEQNWVEDFVYMVPPENLGYKRISANFRPLDCGAANMCSTDFLSLHDAYTYAKMIYRFAGLSLNPKCSSDNHQYVSGPVLTQQAPIGSVGAITGLGNLKKSISAMKKDADQMVGADKILTGAKTPKRNKSTLSAQKRLSPGKPRNPAGKPRNPAGKPRNPAGKPLKPAAKKNRKGY